MCRSAVAGAIQLRRYAQSSLGSSSHGSSDRNIRRKAEKQHIRTATDHSYPAQHQQQHMRQNVIVWGFHAVHSNMKANWHFWGFPLSSIHAHQNGKSNHVLPGLRLKFGLFLGRKAKFHAVHVVVVVVLISRWFAGSLKAVGEKLRSKTRDALCVSHCW